MEINSRNQVSVFTSCKFVIISIVEDYLNLLVSSTSSIYLKNNSEKILISKKKIGEKLNKNLVKRNSKKKKKKTRMKKE